MKAAVLREVGQPLSIEQLQIGKPGAHEVLIRTAAAGVCHSDLHFIEGKYPAQLPIVLGHESAGIVEQVGSEVRSVRPGDHVITCLSVFCGHCEHCLTGRMSLCRSSRCATAIAREEADAGSAPAMASAVPFAGNTAGARARLRRDPPRSMRGAGRLRRHHWVGAVIHTSNVRPGETVAVIGCGGVGLAAINGAAIAGAGRIIAIDTSASKDNLVRQFGATDFVHASQDHPVAKVMEHHAAVTRREAVLLHHEGVRGNAGIGRGMAAKQIGRSWSRRTIRFLDGRFPCVFQ